MINEIIQNFKIFERFVYRVQTSLSSIFREPWLEREMLYSIQKKEKECDHFNNNTKCTLQLFTSNNSSCVVPYEVPGRLFHQHSDAVMESEPLPQESGLRPHLELLNGQRQLSQIPARSQTVITFYYHLLISTIITNYSVDFIS